MLKAVAIGRHARGDRPWRHTHTVPTGSAWRQTSSTGASVADRRRPLGFAQEAIPQEGLRQPRGAEQMGGRLSQGKTA